MTVTEDQIGRASEDHRQPEVGAWRWALPKSSIAVITIAITGYLAFGLFFVPALFMDDWTSVVERVVTGNAQWFDAAQRRPLLFAVFLAQYYLLGLNLVGYYILLWSAYALMALVVYKIIARLPLYLAHEFGLGTALLFLVYPANYTHMWAIMVGVSVSALLSLLYGYWLLRYAQESRWLFLTLALLCLVISLGIYEAQLGIAALWAVVLAAGSRERSTRVRILLLAPIACLGLFALWRTIGPQSAGGTDPYLSTMTVKPQVLMSRLFLGYKIVLGWGWTTRLEQSMAIFGGAKMAVLLIGVSLVSAWWGVRFATLRAGRRKADQEPWKAPQGAIRSYLWTVGLGLILIGAGYVPVILVFLPSLSGVGSRFNLYATLGGSIVIAASLMVGSLLLARYRAQVAYLFLAATLPFLAVGVFTQASVQYHNRIAWQEQQDIWGQLFRTAPHLEDETFVLFVLPGLEERSGFRSWRRTPLSASWEVSSALRLLYGNPTLAGDVFFPDIDEPTEAEVTEDGLRTWETGTVTRFSQIAAFVYDQDSATLYQLDALTEEYVPGLAVPITLCADCVTRTQTGSPALRRLVETGSHTIDSSEDASAIR